MNVSLLPKQLLISSHTTWEFKDCVSGLLPFQDFPQWYERAFQKSDLIWWPFTIVISHGYSSATFLFSFIMYRMRVSFK